MRVTLLGHAALLVEMRGATCVMDPVFFDPFEEGAVTSCPRREVFPEQLPPIHLVVVSHRHPDHFDIPSLALLPREADVILPGDAVIVYALKELGFRHIHPVEPMAPIRSQSFELYPTRSELHSIREFGLVFKDASGTFWNQVDSWLADATIDRVRERFGGIDLLFARYASQNFEYFETRATEFPLEEHRRNLAAVLRIAPRHVVPGAAGFRFCGAQAWLNRFLFPISRERFVTDLGQAGFAGGAHIVNPGDVVEIADGGVRLLAAASPVAVTREDDSAELAFDPTAAVPELRDPNPDGLSRAVLRRRIAPFVEGLKSYAESAGDEATALYRRQRGHYALSIVFADGPADRYDFDFSEGAGASAHVVNRIAASALAGWIACDKSFFYVRAHSRRHQTAYELAADGAELRLAPQPLPDLLMHYLLNRAPSSATAMKRFIDRQIAGLSAS